MRPLRIVLPFIFFLTACQGSAVLPPPLLNSTQNSPPQDTRAQPIEIKAVVVTRNETNEYAVKPQQASHWKDGLKLDTPYPFSVLQKDIYLNVDTGVMEVAIGTGQAKAAATIMALGLDSRFDLTHAYWLVTDIAGVDPQDTSIGSAVWANWLIDGNLAHEMDPKVAPEASEDRTAGFYSLSTSLEKMPIDETAPVLNGEAYRLNTQLTHWAYELSKDVALYDTPSMYELRQKYRDYPNARRRPFVLVGAHISKSAPWYGFLQTKWANDWANYWSDHQGNFVISAKQDTAIYQALVYLENINKVDTSRLMALGAASHYTMPPAHTQSMLSNLEQQSDDGLKSKEYALESVYNVGSVVIDDIVKNWDDYRHALPYQVSKAVSGEDILDNISAPITNSIDTKRRADELLRSLSLPNVEGAPLQINP